MDSLNSENVKQNAEGCHNSIEMSWVKTHKDLKKLNSEIFFGQ